MYIQPISTRKENAGVTLSTNEDTLSRKTRTLLAKAILPREEDYMLYHLDFHIEYPASMSQKDLFSIFAREAEAATAWRALGTGLSCLENMRGEQPGHPTRAAF